MTGFFQLVRFSTGGKSVEAHFHKNSSEVEMHGNGMTSNFAANTPVARFDQAQKIAMHMLETQGIDDIHSYVCDVIPRKVIEAAAISKNPPTFEA